jgi:hypothetical protein
MLDLLTRGLKVGGNLVIGSVCLLISFVKGSIFILPLVGELQRYFQLLYLYIQLVYCNSEGLILLMNLVIVLFKAVHLLLRVLSYMLDLGSQTVEFSLKPRNMPLRLPQLAHHLASLFL